jgi:nucleotide-binding universal stress UspA family protein
VSTILIGVDAGERSKDAIAFARRLADVSDAYLVLANAYPYSDLPSRASNTAFREALRDKSLEIVQAMRERLEGLPEQRSSVKITANPSPAHALHKMADVEDAELIVVGSTHTSRAGRVLPGSTGERLIHGSPCAVAVVPTDYRERTEPIRKVGVAYNETPEARVAVFAAAKLAKALGAELVVIGVADASGFEAPALMGGPSVASVRVDIDRHVQESLDALVAELPEDVTATTKRLTGDPADMLADHSAYVDLLVTGSRGYGPLHSVLAGGVSGRVLRTAQCPVIIVPRGVETALSGLFADATTNTSPVEQGDRPGGASMFLSP